MMEITIKSIRKAASRQGEWDLKAHVDAKAGDFNIRRAFLYRHVEDGDRWRIAVGSGDGSRRDRCLTLPHNCPTRDALLAAAVEAYHGS